MTGDASGGGRGDRFADLQVRTASAALMLCLGIIAIYYGGRVFELFTVLIAGVMTWELARLGQPDRPGQALVIAAATALSVLGAAERPWLPDAGVLLLGPALFLITPRRDRLLAAVWTGLVVMACLQLFEARQASVAAVVLLVGIVIVSDLAGYFAGRTLGGPKFWPRLSPKKTWSGTVAGWIAATLWVWAIHAWIEAEPIWLLYVLAPVFALAGQMGDMFESWMKRRAGVKDASQLIPGHGGVMDRFDAITGAAALGMALEWLRMALGGA